jgi:hypothetical protein
MNKLILFLTITLMLKPIFPVVDYLVNYEYISKVLCENKAKPKLKCNGKCQLMKGLAKASEEEKPINSDKKNNLKQESEVLFYLPLKEFEIENTSFQVTTTTLNNYSNLYTYLNGFSIFHPPTFII